LLCLFTKVKITYKTVNHNGFHEKLQLSFSFEALIIFMFSFFLEYVIKGQKLLKMFFYKQPLCEIIVTLPCEIIEIMIYKI